MVELTRQSSARVVSLLGADEDFARHVPASDHPLAERALTLRELRMPAGASIPCGRHDELALLVLAGAVWREIRVGAGGAPQLLGPGAVVCEAPPCELASTLDRSVTLTDVRLAVLDRRFLLASARWPALATDLLRRLAEQERDLAIQAAICQLPRVEDRLLTLLWHLAERWGRVSADGVRLPLRLTHATLGRFVGARRPTVSLALAQLRDRGVLDRDDDGLWLLHGEPPEMPGSAGHHIPDLFAAG